MANTFYIVSELNGLVLDVEGASSCDGAKLITHPYNGGANQQFKFKSNGEILSLHSGKGLNIEHGACQGNKIIQWPSCSAANQLWRIHKDGTIRNVGSNLCLDICNSNVASGASVIAWPHNGCANQRWRLVNSSTASECL